MANSNCDNGLHKYNRLLNKLGTSVKEVLSLPQITPYITRRLKLQREEVIELLRISDDPDAQSFLQAYDDRRILKDLREKLPYEMYCAMSKVTPSRLLQLLGGLIVETGRMESALLAARAHADVVQATIDSALTPEGVSDRQTLHKATGFLPQPKGAQTTITVQTSAQAQANAQQLSVSAPPPELTIKKLVDRFNDARGLKGEVVAAPKLCQENAREYAPEIIEEAEADEDEDKLPIAIPAMSPISRLAKKMSETSPEE